MMTGGPDSEVPIVDGGGVPFVRCGDGDGDGDGDGVQHDGEGKKGNTDEGVGIEYNTTNTTQGWVR